MIPVVNRLIIIFILFPFAFQTYGQVTYRDTLLSWNHFDFTLDENHGMNWFSTTSIVTEEYPGIVLENEFVTV